MGCANVFCVGCQLVERTTPTTTFAMGREKNSRLSHFDAFRALHLNESVTCRWTFNFRGKAFLGASTITVSSCSQASMHCTNILTGCI